MRSAIVKRAGLFGMALSAACSSATGSSPPRHPVALAEARHPVALPQDGQVRQRVLHRAGRRFYEALAAGRPEQLLFDDLTLRRLLDPRAATRASAMRAGLDVRLSHRPEAFEILERARYLGICLQGSRLEPAGSPVGLRREGWMFERALVAGRRPGGRRLGAWLEGWFLYTDVGFGAISLNRAEEPRWEHSDLALAPCDMEAGLRDTQHVVGVIR